MSVVQASPLQIESAARVRATYCRERNRWHGMRQGKNTNWGVDPIARYDGGEDSSGRTFKKNVWLEIVRYAAQNQLNPIKLVRAQFMAATTFVPEPTQCLSARGLALYHELVDNQATTILQQFQAQKTALASELSRMAGRKASGATDQDLLLWALGNTLISLSPLFRFCAARCANIEDIAVKLLGEAIEQYLEAPDDYDRIWGVLIPAELRVESQKLAAEPAPPSPRFICLD